MAINYNECIRFSFVTAGGGSTTSVLSGVTDVKVRDRKIYDTSSSADAFSGLSAGDAIKISGFDDDACNGITDVVEVESSGEWIKVNIPLFDIPSSDIPSAGITITKAAEILTVHSDMTSKDYINDVANFNTASSSPADTTYGNFGVTNDGKMAVFGSLDSGDVLGVLWSKTSQG